MTLNEGCEWPDDDRLLLCTSCMTSLAEKTLSELTAQTDLNAKLTAERDAWKRVADAESGMNSALLRNLAENETEFTKYRSDLTQSQQRVTELTARVAELEEINKKLHGLVNFLGDDEAPTPQQPTAPETHPLEEHFQKFKAENSTGRSA